MKAHTTVLDRAKQRLEHAGLRMTAPRIRLLETLIADHGPFSVDDLLGLPSAKGMDRVTVYRGLQTFEEVGLVSRCEFGDGVSRYEFIHEGHHHHHVVCRSCKKTENIEECIPPQILKAVQKLGYADVSHSLEFFGVCKSCQKG
jgi:Fur family ferric uptake transcriptional regulator